jgi:hypothetical protein
MLHKHFVDTAKEVLDEGALDLLYNIFVGNLEDCVNLINGGELNWCRVCSFAIYFEDSFNVW